VTQEELLTLVIYIAGHLHWKARDRSYFSSDGYFKRWNNRFVGKRIGTKNKDGYIHACVLGDIYKEHRLIWLYFNGEFPTNVIDHINKIKDDNRIENLRDVEQVINSRNCLVSKNNTSGYSGISKIESTGRWRVRINDKAMKRIHVGVYDTLEEAILKRKEAERLYGYS